MLGLACLHHASPCDVHACPRPLDWASTTIGNSLTGAMRDRVRLAQARRPMPVAAAALRRSTAACGTAVPMTGAARLLMTSKGTVTAAKARLGGCPADFRRQAPAARDTSRSAHKTRHERRAWAAAVKKGSLRLWARQKNQPTTALQAAVLVAGKLQLGAERACPMGMHRQQAATVAAKAAGSPFSQNVAQEHSRRTRWMMCSKGSTV
mmetsp:Transcript_93209/g.272831  ORF Transcript_93209/g.272831 Transcript_93209/m.272831 type:complete len:208 (-) Transcript_93209:974-1597(-)